MKEPSFISGLHFWRCGKATISTKANESTQTIKFATGVRYF